MRLDDPDLAPAVVDLDLPVAGLAVKDVLVVLLDAEFPDVLRGGIVLGLALSVELLLVLGVDPRDIADDVREEISHRVVALELRHHGELGVAEAVYGKDRHLLLGELVGNRDLLEGAALADLIHEDLLVVLVEPEVQQLIDLVVGLLYVIGL